MAELYAQIACDYDYNGYESKPLPVGRQVMPLSSFPLEHRRRIEEQAQAPEPPERNLRFELFTMPSRAWYEWYWHRGIDPDKRRERLPQWLRDHVIDRDGLICGLCGEPVELSDVHIDHILPRSLGGLDRAENLQVAHSLCNMRKGNRV